MNSPPFTYAYNRARQNLEDAFVTAGSGVSGTYRSGIPVFRIDHVFHDEGVDVTDHTVIKTGLSDHYPILVNFDINKD